ncbi:hypothetical protein C2G38_2138184 [Gigaspora rosea]|uniref:Uncharacterized protein n=1 Tax=Gigaspora rosea TaxID=44941 RepID=A0A397VVR9_9GLOM|nr:hypothetical protein C2G38_2138184 [Gigaspora rosea]
MPCYADTIVRIKYVRRTEREDIKSLVVWAIGSYPVERDDCEIEMVLFLPLESQERDSETQAIFERDCFYSVGDNSCSFNWHIILNKVINSNKCPLKVSLVGIPQELPRIVGTDGNSVVNVLVNDYAGREYNFIIKVVFPHSNSRFTHLVTMIRPEDSLIFVVGQLEVIGNEFYVYSKDINYIDVRFPFKQKVSSNNSSSEASNTAHSKLLSVHHNITKELEDSSEVEAPSLMDSCDSVNNLSLVHHQNMYELKV